MSPKAPSKDMRELLRKLTAQGATIERLGSGHFRVSRPGAFPVVTLSGTAVGGGTWQKMRSLLRRLLHFEV